MARGEWVKEKNYKVWHCGMESKKCNFASDLLFRCPLFLVTNISKATFQKSLWQKKHEILITNKKNTGTFSTFSSKKNST